MASYDEVMTALRNADKAGASEDARALAKIASSMKPKAEVEIAAPVLKSPTQVKNKYGGAEWQGVDKMTNENAGPIVQGLMAVPEAAVHMGSSFVAKPVSEVMGMSAKAFGPKDGDPEAFKRYIQENLTYEPKTSAGKAVSEYNPLALMGKGVGLVGEKVGEGIRGGANSTPFRFVAGNVAEEAINQVPQFLGVKAGGKAAKAASDAEFAKRQAELNIQRGVNLPKDLIRSSSQEAGIKTPPEGVSWLASIPGMTKIDKWISAENEPKFNRLVAEDIGIPKGVAITTSELESIRDRASKPYTALIAAGEKIKPKISPPSLKDAYKKPVSLGKEGFQTTPQFKQNMESLRAEINGKMSELPETFGSLHTSSKLIQEYASKDSFSPRILVSAIRKLRRDATTEFKSDDPVKVSSAFTRKSIADSLESMIDENLIETGQTQLLTEVKQAREKIAKTHDVEASTDNVGNVDARKLYLLSQKRPLSGNLKLVADYAGAYPQGAQKVVSGRSATSMWGAMFDMAAAAGGHLGLAALDVAGRVGIPYAAQKGAMQGRNPSYIVRPPMLPTIGPPVGAAISSEARDKMRYDQTPPDNR